MARALGFAVIETELLAPLPVNECASRLTAAVTPFSSFFVAGPVYGEVAGTRLRAQKQGAVLPTHLEADLIDTGRQTSIKCRFTVRWLQSSLILVLLGSLITKLITAPAREIAVVVPMMLGGILLISCILLYFAHKQRRFLLDFLEHVVGAREVRRSVAA